MTTSEHTQQPMTQEEMRAEALHQQAWELFGQKKQYETCLALLNEAIALLPEADGAYHLRGNVYYELKKYEEAARDLTKAYKLAPCNWEAIVDLANVSVARNLFDQALILYDAVAELDLETEDKAILCFNRAVALAKKGSLLQAIDEYSRAIELDPTSTNAASALLNRGTTRASIGQTTEALADYQRAYTLDPGDSNNAWTATWACHLGKEPMTEEIIFMLQAIEALDPDHYVASLCRGVIALYYGNVQIAQEHFVGAAQQEPEQWDPAFWLGLVYALQKDQEKARQAIESALSLGLPPLLLAPLYWAQTASPEFFASYAAALLQSVGL